MRYELKIHWKGTRVLEARCTAVMAWDILRGAAKNFVPAPDLPMPLVDVANAPTGTIYAAEWSQQGDDESVMRWKLEAKYDAPIR